MERRPKLTQNEVKNISMAKLAEIEQEEEMVVQPIVKGQGKLITSGKTVHGFESEFSGQLQIGDYIILMRNTNTGKEESSQDKLVEQERRRVNMVLSSKSCGLEEPFTHDVIDKSDYYIQRRP